MKDAIEPHQGGDEPDELLFHPHSNMYGRELEFEDSYAEDLRWKVPAYLQGLPYDFIGNVMYHVHAVLGNIAVNNQEARDIHREAVSIFSQAHAEKYLREQLKITNRVLH